MTKRDTLLILLIAALLLTVTRPWFKLDELSMLALRISIDMSDKSPGWNGFIDRLPALVRIQSLLVVAAGVLALVRLKFDKKWLALLGCALGLLLIPFPVATLGLSQEAFFSYDGLWGSVGMGLVMVVEGVGAMRRKTERKEDYAGDSSLRSE